MAQIAAIVINNGAATPVARTFSPQDATMQMASWIDRTGGIATGMPMLSLSAKFADSTSETSVTRINGKIALPIMEVISNNTNSGYQPLPKVAYTGYGRFEFSLPGRMTLDQRRDVLAFLRNFLANAAITSSVEGFERPW